MNGGSCRCLYLGLTSDEAETLKETFGQISNIKAVKFEFQGKFPYIDGSEITPTLRNQANLCF